MPPSTRPSLQDVLPRLVENALDFLLRAVHELDDKPKHSSIAFYTGVELFLKARLLAEHWSLIVAPRQEPDLDAFLMGNFVSVSLDEAANRLNKVIGSPLTREELSSFKTVGRRRNKAVHFFVEEADADARAAMTREMIVEQLDAWFHLRRILSTRWKEVFAPWANEIERVQEPIRRRAEFLQITFDQLQPELTQAAAAGITLRVCSICGFTSEKHPQSPLHEPYLVGCPVCENRAAAVQSECPSCMATITFVSDGYGECSCGEAFEPGHLADLLDEPGRALQAAMDGDFTPAGNCENCDGYQTIVTTRAGTHFCVQCFEVANSLECCEWCMEPNSGDMEGSYWKGCSVCDGKAGSDRDR